MTAAFFLSVGALSVLAQSSTSCLDRNAYPQSKNVGSTGNYTLTLGQLEYAAQTYQYSGPGTLTSVRIFGFSPTALVGVPMRARVYSVDANGRPVSVLSSANFVWGIGNNLAGFATVDVPDVALATNFAVSAEVIGGIPGVSSFHVGYNGDGDGNGEDLASLAGSTTGFVWQSAFNNFGRDGDFYIIPRMNHFITSNFMEISTCVATGTAITFNNLSSVSQDPMFNTINLPGYSGGNNVYTWNFGDGSPVSHTANPTKTYANPGVYTVTLTVFLDGWEQNCSVSYSRSISVGLGATVSNINAVSCFGGSNGSFTVSGSGGATPYQYSLNGTTWFSGGTFSNLTAGIYTVYVRDALGCQKTTTATVNQPSPISWITTGVTNATCGTNADGSILLAATGGTGSLQYSLDGTTWQTSGSFTGLSAGSYTAYVKDANNCQNTVMLNISNAGAPSLFINSVTQVTCFGASTGSIILSSSGGTGTPQYSLDGINYQSSGTFTSLPAGNYSAYVKDQAGCIDVKTVQIIQPAQITFSATASSVSCNGGSNGTILISNVTGGTGVPVFSINGVNYQSGNLFSGLAAGTYSVFVKDVAQCISTASVSISQPAPITLSTNAINNTCHNDFNGSVTITANGGTPPYNYSINGITFQPTPVFTELAAGVYTFTVKDANNCLATVSATVTQPSIISAVITAGNSACGNNNGTILVVGSGGSGSGYQYSLDGVNFSGVGSFAGLGQGTYTIFVKDGSGCTREFSTTITDSNGPSINSFSATQVTCNGGSDGTIAVTNVTGGSGTIQYSINGSPFQNSPSFSGLAAGTYVVVVSDGLGCTGSISVTLTQPAQIIVNTVVANVNCHGSSTGSVNISSGGGAGVLSYSLDGTNFQSSSVFNNLAAGNYYAFVKDQGNCIGFTTFSVTQPPAIFISNKGILNVTCHGGNNGSMLITAGGGVGTLLFSLDGVNYSTGNSFTGLSAGFYTVYVKDANNCVKTSAAQITEPPALVTNAMVYDVSCTGGSNGVIDFVVYGGVPPYLFQWSNGNNTEDIFNLTPGQYTILVTDANGCTVSSGYTITEPNNPIVVNGVVINASSATSSNGSIDITVSGGTLPYSFEWSNGAISEDINGLTPGSYLVTITDLNGCEVSAFYTVGVSAGVEEILTETPEVIAYPVPADNRITFEAEGYTLSQIDLINMYGQTVYSAFVNSTSAQVDVAHLAAGTYLAKISINGQTLTRKIQIYH